MKTLPQTLLIMALLIATTLPGVAKEKAPEGPRKETHSFTSTHDQSRQSLFLFRASGEAPRPLLVLLHHWSADLKHFDPSSWVTETTPRNWHLIAPHFRGANNKPEACASPAAQQDILDAVDWACQECAVDPSRIYLAGVSGGGHMAMMMASAAPERWAAVSAWVGISDLRRWHKESVALDQKYWKDIEAVAGGAPGDSEEVDEELFKRSPIHFLQRAAGIPLDLNAGINDGHKGHGSVPIHHTLDAFSVIARTLDAPQIPQEMIDRLTRLETEGLQAEQDPSYGRRLHLRNYAGFCRVTIFEGRHEGLPPVAMAWLEHFRKPGL